MAIELELAGSGGVATTETAYNVDDLVREACKVGYRFFDCAEYYGNEDKVGLALENCGIKREELYIASKVWTTTVHQGAEAVRAQVMKSLKDLRTTYFDLYLIHWPVPGKHVEAYLELEKLREEGVIRSIGVSNYTVEDYEELMAKCSVPPAINQIEVNPFLYRKKTIDFFKSKNCHIQAYRSLCNGKAFEHPLLLSLSEKYGRPVAQILGAFIIQQGLIYMAKSTKVKRIQENYNVAGIELEADDIQALEGLTTPEACEKYITLYKKCVVRDTPLESQTGDVGVKQVVTAE